MKDHRIRLNDEELDLVLAALRGRLAGHKGVRRSLMAALAERLSEGKRGNPNWILGRNPSPPPQDAS